jgi:acetyl esterase
MPNVFQSLEPNTRLFLERLTAQNEAPLAQLSLAQARGSLANMQQASKAVKMPATIDSHVITAGPTGKIAIRIVRREGKIEPLPIVMFFHGGGWVRGDADTHDRLIREIANGAEAAVVAVDFDRSPEVRYPIGDEQAYAATTYVTEHAGKWKLDGSRVAVVGDSAGGNMATVVSMLARDRGGPAIGLQVLFYPTTDANFNTPSDEQFAEGFFLARADMEWFWEQYLPDQQTRITPTASPLQASLDQLRGLPPAPIFTGEFDVLRDEGEAYAHRLMAAGVTVTRSALSAQFTVSLHSIRWRVLPRRVLQWR